ncbi:protocadherin Fat 4-like [Tribolium madens]|uniref:protocadherin Fat 4-like n=1 Tax=Tribolium madens TaxID=41895 RepID=UPI001CF73EC7|nr:protocadherin Fat 4-like [Tribolium madens]XP_044258009.1 protocadherin Fat 4-like [Tribolium madens]
MRFTFWVFLGILHYVSSFQFKDANSPGVHFDDLISSGQPVTVDEDNDGARVVAVLVTDVKDVLQINDFDQEKKLNAKVEPRANPNEYSITINRLDYEKLSSTYLFPLDITDGEDPNTRQTLLVIIKNLDDESPTLTTSNCEMEEMKEYTVDNSKCVFQVSDPDGFLIQMNFENIVGTRGEKDLFEFEYKDDPSDTTTTSDVYLILKEGVTLDYDNAILYSFHVEAKDGAGHETTPVKSVPIIVQVKDMPNKPPVWDKFQSALTIPEKQLYTTQVSARDGDYGINNNISYSIDDPSGYVKIDSKNGTITIDPIDRDAGNDQITIQVTATEVEDPDSKTSDQILLLIEDIDDNIPKIYIDDTDDKKNLELTIDEGSNDIDTKISVSDIDLGENAIYTVELTSDNADFLTAFAIIPGRGYENTTLTLTILDSKKLDFEQPDWRKIMMELHTKGTKNASMADMIPITINLNDINDETPQFGDVSVVKVREDVPSGYVIASIQATDADAEDIEAGLKHELLGTLANNILTIEALGGNITTKVEDAFDYEKQNEVYIQIMATDLANHTATTQLTIQVQDVNDENPKLVVSSSIEIGENQDDGTELKATITASDEDTTADLEFSIDWSQSYATKNSRRIKDEDFAKYHCINVETVAGATNHAASAKLTINETQKKNTPDYELFDSLYIYLKVIDKNTEKNEGFDFALIAITIGDKNDNSPEFSNNADDKRQVTENSGTGTVIGSITATDKDVGDNITYSIQPVDDKTPNWVAVDEITGSLFVNLEDNDVIDSDKPEGIFTYNVTYTITASDGVHNTSIDITIDIKDQNDLSPQLGNQEKEISEDNGLDDNSEQNGALVLELDPKDGDRDEPFHTVKCSFSSTTSTDVTNRFKIDDQNRITVNLSAGATLDRETNPEFTFDLRCIDDPTEQGPISNPVDPPPKITIKLKDVNDNYPTVITTSLPKLTENTKQGPLSTQLQGEDKDEGDNGKMTFLIASIERCQDEALKNCESASDTLFDIETSDTQTEATLILNEEDLRDNYGYLKFTINTTDLGEPPLSSVSTVSVEVSKFNFEEPKFTFPADGATYYLKTTQNKDSSLKMWNDDVLDNFVATDQQKDKYAILFKIVEDSSGENLFKVSNRGGSQAQLQMSTSSFTAKPYTITVMAYLDADESQMAPGEKPYSKNCTFHIDFFDKDKTDPVFTNHKDSTEFEENSLEPQYQVENATYPDVDISGLDIFYLLREGNDSIFDVDIKKGLVTLKTTLDFEEVKSYTLVIQSSNKDTINSNAIEETKFHLTINVKDVNDNPPVFDQKEYISILTSGTGIVLTISATDIDTTSQGKLIYAIDSIESHSSGVSNSTVKDYFKIEDPKSGVIKHNFQVSDSMDGYFTLYLSVHDEDPTYLDKATAQIYLVTSKHTVNFKFENKQEVVQNATGSIKSILEAQFNYSTTVEDPKKDSEADENKDQTIVPVFFLDTKSHEPKEATEILKQVTKVDKFQSLKEEFLKVGLLLMSFSSDSDTTENLEETLKAWLIGVSVVLGSLCLILLIAFILRTRALSQRIQKLSSTKFGSQESGLNRVGLAAPTTNKHAIEGSNPVYNNDVDTKEVDRRSVTSGDSDLIGVEDDDKFNYDNTNKEALD